MKCPKCGDITRKKMTGAVCLNANCNWHIHDVSTVKSKFIIEDGKGNTESFEGSEEFDEWNEL